MRRLTHRAILTLLVASLPALLPTVARADDPAAPKAVVAATVVDSGKVPVGQPVETTFKIENKGTAPLTITQVHPSCGCTVADYDKVIAPGATGEVRTKVDTTAMAGPIAKAVTVYTDDPANPRIVLTIKALVQPFLGLSPGYARFTSAVHGDRDQKSPQILWADDFKDLQVLKVESPKAWIETSYREATDTERQKGIEGKQWRIDVTLAKNAPIGPIADQIVVTTNDPKQKIIEIPVSGFVRPMVAVTPPSVNFNKVDPTKEQKWGLLVRNFGSTPLEIQKVHSSVAGLKVDVEPIEAGQRFKLVFTPTSAMAKGTFDGQVSLTTNLPQDKTIVVPVKGEVQ